MANILENENEINKKIYKSIAQNYSLGTRPKLIKTTKLNRPKPKRPQLIFAGQFVRFD